MLPGGHEAEHCSIFRWPLVLGFRIPPLGTPISHGNPYRFKKNNIAFHLRNFTFYTNIIWSFHVLVGYRILIWNFVFPEKVWLLPTFLVDLFEFDTHCTSSVAVWPQNWKFLVSCVKQGVATLANLEWTLVKTSCTQACGLSLWLFCVDKYIFANTETRD